MKKLYIAVAVLVAVAVTESCMKLRLNNQSSTLAQQEQANK